MINTMIGKLADEKGLTITQLSERTKVTYRTAYDLYHNKVKRISYEVLEKMCLLLEVTPGEILVLDKDKD